MLQIVMDGAGDVDSGWIETYGIHVIPINIQFGEKTFLQGIDLSNEEFYKMVYRNGTVPKTAQPSPQQFIQLYQRIAQPGDDILSIHVTAKLSGTYESSVMAARELQGQIRVFPIDSGAGSAAMGYMCKEARMMERRGASIQAILQRMETIRQNMSILLTLDNLDFARMSGRVRTLQAALASLLNVKPVIFLRDGVLEIGERVRTRKRAMEYVLNRTVERFGSQKLNVTVVHAMDPVSGQQLMAGVKEKLNCQELFMTDLSIGVAANLGPGTVGIIAYPVEVG